LINSTIFVLFDKYCPIVNQLGSKDSSRDFQLNCVISYFFTYIYYFMHGSEDWCDRESEKILTLGLHLNKGLICVGLPLGVAIITSNINGPLLCKLWIRNLIGILYYSLHPKFFINYMIRILESQRISSLTKFIW
jgi:hypothetical protein